MPGALTTISILDKDGNAKTMRVWDESGIGDGPFQFVKLAAKSDGVTIDPATSTKQPALGTAGTASADVLTVQGVASMTPLNVSESISNIAVNQVSVATSATLIVAARAGRKSVTITNEGTTDVRIGPSGVTTGTGILLSGIKGAGLVIDGGAAIYGIVAAGTQTVSYLEAY